MENKPPEIEFIFSSFAAMPPLQLVLLGLSAVTWLIGGNLLIHFHRKRIGKQHFSEVHPWKYFNAKEWLTFVLLFFIACSFGIMALAYGKYT